MYTLANASVKIANKKFTSIKNDYCLTLSDQTVITEVLEDAKITQSGFSFTGLREIEDIVDTCTLDVIGVIMDVQPTVSIMTKSGLNSPKRFLCSACPGATWQNKGPCAKSLKKSTWPSYNLAAL